MCSTVVKKRLTCKKQDGKDLAKIKHRFLSSYAGLVSYLWGRGRKRKSRGQRSSSSASCKLYCPLSDRRRTERRRGGAWVHWLCLDNRGRCLTTLVSPGFNDFPDEPINNLFSFFLFNFILFYIIFLKSLFRGYFYLLCTIGLYIEYVSTLWQSVHSVFTHLIIGAMRNW